MYLIPERRERRVRTLDSDDKYREKMSSRKSQGDIKN